MKENVKTFVKKHWKAIAITTAVVGGTVVYIVTRKGKVPDVSKLKSAYKQAEPFITDGKYKLSDLGKLGVDIVDHNPVMTMDTVVDMVNIYCD
jgi:hypothetical protein